MRDQWFRYFRHYAKETFPAFVSSRRWNYKNDICMLGLEKLLNVTGDECFRDALLGCGAALCDGQGNLNAWDDSAHNLDFVSFGKSLWILYDLTGNEAYRNAAFMIRRNLAAHPRTDTGNYWHKDIYPHQVWLDGLYMALPFQARCGLEAGESDFSDILRQFETVRRIHFLPDRGLYVHAWDSSRTMDWADPVTGLSPCVWLRAEGWLLMALCDVYGLIGGQGREAEVLKDLLREAVSGLLPYRDPESGMFLQLADRPDLPGNYPETSGTAMIAYALMKGCRLGMLNEAAGRLGEDVFDRIRVRYLTDGPVPVLRGICGSAGLGPGPDHRTDRDGSPAYYLSEKQIDDNQHGAAPCMMAGAELLIRENARPTQRD